MAAPSTIATYEAYQEEEIEKSRPWLAVLVILLAIGLYLSVDLEKRRMNHVRAASLIAEQTK
jgi:hypothetical protein